MTSTVLLDDVTHRHLAHLGVTAAEWVEGLPTDARGDRPDVQGVTLSRINVHGPWGHRVVDTLIEIVPGLRYTRSDRTPGPQIILDGRIADTVAMALPGEPATRIAEHPCLAGSNIGEIIRTTSYAYLNLEMPLVPIRIGRDLDAEARAIEEEWRRWTPTRRRRVMA